MGFIPGRLSESGNEHANGLEARCLKRDAATRPSSGKRIAEGARGAWLVAASSLKLQASGLSLKRFELSNGDREHGQIGITDGS